METPSGFILINKPSGITSHDVVDRLRKITGIRKIGHAGTLDPLATGLLVIAIGRAATKQISQYVKLDKVYIAGIKLGAVSTSYDADGEIMPLSDDIPLEESIKKVVDSFRGEQDQIPPMFSAKKVGGKKLYELARQGKEIERTPHHIIIHNIQLDQYVYPDLQITVHCSTGTYIRTLAHDIGQNLGIGAYITTLHRTQVGDLHIDDAQSLDHLTTDNWSQSLFLPS